MDVRRVYLYSLIGNPPCFRKCTDVQNRLHTSENDIIHCIMIEDILTFTRKPLFIVIDSNASKNLKPSGNTFGRPFVCLFSPMKYKNEIRGKYFFFLKLISSS